MYWCSAKTDCLIMYGNIYSYDYYAKYFSLLHSAIGKSEATYRKYISQYNSERRTNNFDQHNKYVYSNVLMFK